MSDDGRMTAKLFNIAAIGRAQNGEALITVPVQELTDGDRVNTARRLALEVFSRDARVVEVTIEALDSEAGMVHDSYFLYVHHSPSARR